MGRVIMGREFGHKTGDHDDSIWMCSCGVTCRRDRAGFAGDEPCRWRDTVSRRGRQRLCGPQSRVILGRDDFAGVWRMTRRIADRLGPDGEFDGIAEMVADADNGLRYRESGRLALGSGPPMTAERRYLWRFFEGRVMVAFADGAPFHTFQPAGRVAGTDHPCGADLYRVRYDFHHWPAWQTEWTVIGPRKDYTSLTTYVPTEATADRLARRAGVGQ